MALCPKGKCSLIRLRHNDKRQFARVVKGVDLRSTGGNSAWVRTPQLTRPLGHARLAWRFETMYGSERARARLGDSACEGKSTNNFER